MFRSLFNHLYNEAVNPELKEHIAAVRDSAPINETAPNQGAYKAVHGGLTWIGNIASDYGESHIGEMAREIRDENLDKFYEEY
jgi:hypothetical protein